ncbi:BRO family protein [Aeromonas veronii]|uniref:BRO family protein n=1 Tax=Aeromonas veronii TaxID=654 RepID=UPI0009C19826
MAIAGHPEHDILFIAKQVADAAGLKYGSAVVSNFVKYGGKGEKFLRISELQPFYRNPIGSVAANWNAKATSVLMTEPQAYRLLLRGYAPQSEAFRKWVTEEVLPTIRKTGRYDIAESTTEEAKQFAAIPPPLLFTFLLLADPDQATLCRCVRLGLKVSPSICVHVTPRCRLLVSSHYGISTWALFSNLLITISDGVYSTVTLSYDHTLPVRPRQNTT